MQTTLTQHKFRKEAPVFDVSRMEFLYHNGESELRILDLDRLDSLYNIIVPFEGTQIRALAKASDRIAVGVGVLAQGSRRIEIETVFDTEDKWAYMDIIRVPRVVYDEAGATSLNYCAKKDILFVVLSDQIGVIVVSENLHNGHQVSRVEYKYNIPTDFIDSIRVFGTFRFKVVNDSIRFDATD
jgi:hypothetical protein